MTTKISLSAFLASLACASTLLAGDPLNIRDLAPKNSFVIVGIADLPATVDRFAATSLGHMWSAPEFKEHVDKLKSAWDAAVKERAVAGGFEAADVTWPKSAGLCVAGELDEETGLEVPVTMFFVDWADDGEKSTKWLESALADAEKTAKEDGKTTTYEEIRGRHVLVVTDAEEEVAPEGDTGMQDDFSPPAFGAGAFDFKTNHYAIDKGRVLYASTAVGMGDLLTKIDAANTATDAVSSNPAFAGALELAGGEGDGYVVVLLENLGSIASGSPELAIAQPFLKQIFGDVQAISAKIAANEGTIELAAAVYIPGEKTGLTALLDHSTELTAPPSIVPADAVSYSRFNVRFDAILPTLDEIAAGLPPEFGDMIKMQIDSYRPAMTSAFAAIGPDIHMYGTVPEAGSDAPGKSITAIRMNAGKENEQAVGDMLNLFPMGLESRDFNGMTILSDEFSDFAVGIGGGWLALGSAPSVEQTLRAVDAKDAGSNLSADATYSSSVQALGGGEVVAAGWINAPRQFESTAELMESLQDQVGGMAGGDAEGEEGGDVPMLGIDRDSLPGLETFMNPALIKRFLGQQVWDVRSTDKGYRARYIMLPVPATVAP
ncbi:MAG: hypothetical protein EXS10_08465 [Phycisphaerales bacterium]|nr:hypothetical protein [Phycisphaerales bacterium]